MNIEYRGNAATDLYPQEGILVIGRADDTLRGHVSTTWPRKTDGSYYTNDIFVTATTVTDAILFSANPGRHRGQIVPTETSEWKMWLDHDDIQPGTYMITIGASDEGEPDTPGRDFKLFVLADTTFMLIVEPDTAAQFQGSTGTRIVRLIRAPGFTSPVRLSLRPQNGFTAVFQPETVVGDSSTMFLTVADTVATRLYGLTVEGSGGGATRTAFIRVTVLVAPPNVVRVLPRTLSLAAGQIGFSTITVAGNHIPVTLLQPIEPHVSFQFSPNTTSNTSTLTVTLALQAQTGTRQIPIIGRFSNGQTARDTLTLTITNATGWAQVHQSSTLFGMDVDDATQTGLAVGFGNTYRSTDGGRSWAMGAPIDTLLNTYESVSLKGPRAVAVGFGGAAAVSVDGGLTWTGVSTGISRALYDVSFSDVANGVAVGEGVILRTVNGGSGWSRVPAIGDPYVFLDVSYTSGSAFAVGLNGVIFRSTNHQDNWTQLASGTTMDLWGVSFADANNGIAVGSGGTILLTSDGGSSWVQRNIPQVSSRLDKVDMLSPTIATVGGFAVIYQTFNSGQTWTRDMTSLPFFERVKDIHLSQDNRGVCLVQNNQQTTAATILRRE